MTQQHNLASYLRCGKKATVEVPLFDNIYQCPADPPAIVSIHLALMKANPTMPDDQANQLVQEAIDAVFGAGTYANWITFMPASDMSLVLYFVQYGYDWETLKAFHEQQEGTAEEPERPLPETAETPTSPSATSASASASS